VEKKLRVHMFPEDLILPRRQCTVQEFHCEYVQLNVSRNEKMYFSLL